MGQPRRGRTRGTERDVRFVSAPTQIASRFGSEMGQSGYKTDEKMRWVCALGHRFCLFGPKQTHADEIGLCGLCVGVGLRNMKPGTTDRTLYLISARIETCVRPSPDSSPRPFPFRTTQKIAPSFSSIPSGAPPPAVVDGYVLDRRPARVNFLCRISWQPSVPSASGLK